MVLVSIQVNHPWKGYPVSDRSDTIELLDSPRP